MYENLYSLNEMSRVYTNYYDFFAALLFGNEATFIKLIFM